MPAEQPYDAHEAFKKYLEANSGKPFNPAMTEAARSEIEGGRKSGYVIYGDEPDKLKIAESFPEGELFKTELTIQELRQAIEELTVTRQIFVDYLNSLESKDQQALKQKLQTTTLFQFEDSLAALPEQVQAALSTVAKYGYDGDISMFNLPEELAETIHKEKIILEHLENKSASVTD